MTQITTPHDFIISPNFSGVVSIKGSDSFSFLQNLVTNDLNELETHDIIHACLLTPQGKYLHDFYVRKISGGFALACEGGERMEDLVRRLTHYKLRADVTIAPWAVQSDGWAKPGDDEYINWDTVRIKQSRPDGSRDAEIGSSTLAELNLDISTVSYSKGCYIGQELVARMHNRNLGKKHLVGVEFLVTPPAHGSDLGDFGVVRSSCQNLALVLLSRDMEEKIQQGHIKDAPFRILGL